MVIVEVWLNVRPVENSVLCIVLPSVLDRLGSKALEPAALQSYG